MSFENRVRVVCPECLEPAWGWKRGSERGVQWYLVKCCGDFETSQVELQKAKAHKQEREVAGVRDLTAEVERLRALLSRYGICWECSTPGNIHAAECKQRGRK